METAEPSSAPIKPKLRGVSHQIAFFVALAVGAVVALTAPSAAWPELGVYLVAIPALFGFSALLHRRTWSPIGRQRMRRVDHSMIFIAIASTYTVVGGLALTGVPRAAVLAAVWVGATLGVVSKVLWIDAPKWVSAVAYVTVGWIALPVLPQLVDSLGWGGFGLLVVGGVLYSIGAVVYARQKPDPVPAVFGYHEVFHALVIAGVAAHYVVVELVVLPGL